MNNFQLSDGTPVPLYAYNRAMMVVHARIMAWPGDEWVNLNNRWDLHLMRDEGECMAILYPVDERGNTQTNSWLRLL